MKKKNILRIIVLFAMLLTVFPEKVEALDSSFAPPPVDMFQLPWEQGLAWVAYDGFDNGTRRPPTSPHNFNRGGAIDFAPHTNMVVGEDTSNFWVTAAADGVVTTVSSCHIVINHGNGWTTEYWHLANIQVSVGAVVTRNQRLAVIADNILFQVCTGNQHPGPHLHFVMRPNMAETQFAGWTINFNSTTNATTFSKNGQTLGLFQPLLNPIIAPSTSTPTRTATPTSTLTITNTPTSTRTPTPTSSFTPTNTSTSTNTATLTNTLVFTSTNTPTPTSTPVVTNTFTPTNTASVFTNTPTPTATSIITNTPLVATNTSTSTSTNTPIVNTLTPTATALTGPYVLSVASQQNLLIGQNTLVTVSLNNVPAAGYVSGEFTCTYDANLISVSNITLAGLFGANPVVAINGPNNGSFILAIVGTNGNRATTNGVVFTFQTTALQAGQSPVICTARVSQGASVYGNIAYIGDTITISTAVTSTATNVGLPPPLLNGQVISRKPVTIRLFNLDSTLAATLPANPDGTFNLNAAAGQYIIVASAEGYLNAQGSITLTDGVTTTMPTINLIPGDVDGNSVINQLDALTIGMNYNASIPTAADLNNDGVINVLDLQMLALYYGQSGALVW